MNKLNYLFITLVTVISFNIVSGQIKTHQVSGGNVQQTYDFGSASGRTDEQSNFGHYANSGHHESGSTHTQHVSGRTDEQSSFGHYSGNPTPHPHTNLANFPPPSQTNNNLYPQLPGSHDTYPNMPDSNIYNQYNPQANNPNFAFENRTRQAMATGVCYKEVLTSTLVVNNNRGHVPQGNGTNPTMSRIQVCCEGYERNVHNFYKCDPICENECFNGICAAPNECRCFPDHIVNLGGFCVATCPIGCANGDCLGHTCNCKTGFVLEQHGKFCAPRCVGGCEHGNCTAPNTCTCNEGYELSGEKKCVPKCSQGCGNGVCVAPGVCACLPGYIKDGNLCHAVCDRGCMNGRCSAPNVCTCSRGLVLDSTGIKCVAEPVHLPVVPQVHQPSQPQNVHCESQCLNGVCSGYNQSTCNQGFIHDQQNTYRCVAHCPSGCPNGVCSGPNMCICNAGYVKDRSVKGSQNCVPRL